jgi:hypothetical protein
VRDEMCAIFQSEHFKGSEDVVEGGGVIIRWILNMAREGEMEF